MEIKYKGCMITKVFGIELKGLWARFNRYRAFTAKRLNISKYEVEFWSYPEFADIKENLTEYERKLVPELLTSMGLSAKDLKYIFKVADEKILLEDLRDVERVQKTIRIRKYWVDLLVEQFEDKNFSKNIERVLEYFVVQKDLKEDLVRIKRNQRERELYT